MPTEFNRGTPSRRTVPRFDELPTIANTGEHHSWDFFGRDDHLGTLNFLTPDAVAAAAREIRSGRVVCLSLPLDVPAPPLGQREPFEHVVTVSRMGRDDSLDGFFLQCSSQWDGLQHIRFREFGYYGGRQEEELDDGALGIAFAARHGIVGRGVLADVAKYAEEAGTPLDPGQRLSITPDLLTETLSSQNTELVRGDVLILRTGWMGWYLAQDSEGRQSLARRLHNGPGGLEAPGLDATRTTAAWLWDHGISAIAADNPSLEALPVNRDVGFLHRRLIPTLGMPIGEFWAVDELAEVCARDDRWSFFLTSAPLHLEGGVGSPNNAYAIF